MNICKSCGREYMYDRKKGHTVENCNSCMVNRYKEFKKNLAIQYKGGSCRKCGYIKYRGALDFHHLDPTQKEFQIGGAHGRSWVSLKLELDKCVLLCGNCHAEVHAGVTQLFVDDLKSIPTPEFETLIVNWTKGKFDNLVISQRRLKVYQTERKVT